MYQPKLIHSLNQDTTINMMLLRIPLSQSWAYCFTQPSYIITLLLAILISGFGLYLLATKYDNVFGSFGTTMLTGVLIILFFWALVAKPSDIAAHTTPEQAANGIFIDK